MASNERAMMAARETSFIPVSLQLLRRVAPVARRAERSAWHAVEVHGESISVLPARYLNRLSDLLFILSRVANPDGDVLWRPGGPAQ